MSLAMATVQPAGRRDEYGARGHGGRGPARSLEHLSASTSQFQSAWGAEGGKRTIKHQNMCQVTLPPFSPKGGSTRLIYVSELQLGGQ